MNIEALREKNIDENTLVNNIKILPLKVILETQKLSANFCANYILNKNYQITQEEKNITIDDITQKQKHLKEIDIINALNNK